METNNITTEQTLEDLLAPGKNREDVVARERGVMKKRDFEIRTSFSDVSGRKPKVVIVHPDSGTLSSFFTSCLGKPEIYLFKN